MRKNKQSTELPDTLVHRTLIFNLHRYPVEDKPQLLGVLVDIDEACTQCSKAFLRSRLWDPKLHGDPSTMPTGGEVHRAIQGEQFDAEQYDKERSERYSRRVGFY